MDEIAFGAQRVLQLFADADIAFAGDVAHEPPGDVGDGRNDGLNEIAGAVAADVDEFADPFASLADEFAVGENFFLFAGCAQKFIGAAQHFFKRVAGGALKRGIDVADAQVGVGDEKDIGRDVNRGDEPVDVGFEAQAAAGALNRRARSRH